MYICRNYLRASWKYNEILEQWAFMQQNDIPIKASKQGVRGSSTSETCEKSEDWPHKVKCDQL